ncbi:alpha/beta fold hydrolase [Aestuariispira insulae]|uniref:Esterase FrsA n=1 Tax=Aestuariispira insulae TaxID=1461337 RepID=A0A3D9HE00_9PROT|nr:alpha/beta fold hydrolase [Aestuariispira insulae]RED47694.1 esterase FrsA [Aestuariispira insulae]
MLNSKTTALRTGAAFLCMLVITACMVIEGDRHHFETEEEENENWYHNISRDSWAWQGADPEVIERVLARIASSKNARRDPNLLDSVKDYGPGHWVFEWETAGDQVLDFARKAEQTGETARARKLFFEASSYYTTASYPHLKNDALAMRALNKARLSYQAGGRLLEVPLQTVRIRHGQHAFNAYLHLPKGPGPHPLVVQSMGSDVVKEQALGVFSRHLAPRGIAMLSIDMPGIGESGAFPLTASSDILHVAAVRAMRRHPSVDGDRIAVMGASFGGHPAARILFRKELSLAGSVSICGPLDSAFLMEEDDYAKLPEMTLDAVKDRLGFSKEVAWEQFSERFRSFSLAQQGIYGQSAETPLLVVTTHADPVAPLSDLKPLVQAARNSHTVILYEQGHCPDKDVRYAVAADWLTDLFSRL